MSNKIINNQRRKDIQELRIYLFKHFSTKNKITKSDLKMIINKIEMIDGNYWLIITKSINKGINWNFAIIERLSEKNIYEFDKDYNNVKISNAFLPHGNWVTLDESIQQSNVIKSIFGHNVDLLVQEGIGLDWIDKLLDKELNKIMKKYSQEELIKYLNLIIIDSNFRQKVREEESSASLTNRNIKDYINFNYKKINKIIEIEEVVSLLLDFLNVK